MKKVNFLPTQKIHPLPDCETTVPEKPKEQLLVNVFEVKYFYLNIFFSKTFLFVLKNYDVSSNRAHPQMKYTS
jgi:hypothetical protein